MCTTIYSNAGWGQFVTGPLCIPGYPRTCFVDQGGPELCVVTTYEFLKNGFKNLRKNLIANLFCIVQVLACSGSAEN